MPDSIAGVKNDALTNEPVTPIADWKKVREDGFNMKLPSGKVARIKRTLSLVTAMQNGTIPNPLNSIVTELLEGRRKNLDVRSMDDEQRVAFMDLITNEIPSIFVQPRVELVPHGENPATWEPADPDAISIADVGWEDRSFAYSFAQGGPASLEMFQQATAAMEAMADVPAVPPLSESDPVDS